MNHTTNYQLNQWEAGDKVQRTDFNADNAKIDAALNNLSAQVAGKAGQSALNTLASQIAKCGNCKIVYQTYTGDGTYGEDHPKVFTFPSKPLLVVFGMDRTVAVTFYGSTGLTTINGTSHGTMNIQWSGNSVILVNANSADYQMNNLGTKYTIITLLAAD